MMSVSFLLIWVILYGLIAFFTIPDVFITVCTWYFHSSIFPSSIVVMILFTWRRIRNLPWCNGCLNWHFGTLARIAVCSDLFVLFMGSLLSIFIILLRVLVILPVLFCTFHIRMPLMDRPHLRFMSAVNVEAVRIVNRYFRYEEFHRTLTV